MDTFADIVRLALLIVTAVLVMVCVKVSWRSRHEGKSDPLRLWIPATIVLLLATPVYLMLDDFDTPLSEADALFATALACGLMAMRAMFTVHSDWVRVRIANERDEVIAAREEVREEQDVLRADDRVSQAGERTDSRAMFDAGHLDETEATYDRRADAREEQDDNREHSHQQQDDERAIVRADEDDRI